MSACARAVLYKPGRQAAERTFASTMLFPTDGSDRPYIISRHRGSVEVSSAPVETQNHSGFSAPYEQPSFFVPAHQHPFTTSTASSSDITSTAKQVLAKPLSLEGRGHSDGDNIKTTTAKLEDVQVQAATSATCSCAQKRPQEEKAEKTTSSSAAKRIKTEPVTLTFN